MLVELPKRLERIGAFEAGMVRHLVVARERRIHRRAPGHHVGQHAEDDQISQKDAQATPDECVLHTAMAAWPYVPACGAGGRRQLEKHLPEEEGEQPRRVEAVREKRSITRVRTLLRRDPADGQDHVIRLAGEQVAPACAAISQQSDAGRVPPLDLLAVRWLRAGEAETRLLLDPAERGDVLVRAEQDPGLAGTGLRREVGLPLGERVGAAREPARHLRSATRVDRATEHREREAVDLEEHDSRLRGVDRATRTPRDPLHDAKRVRVVVGDRKQHVEDDADRRRDERRQERPEEPVDDEGMRRDGRRGHQEQRVEDEHEQESEHERVRQPKRRHDGNEDRVEDADDERDGERRAVDIDTDARQQPRSDQE